MTALDIRFLPGGHGLAIEYSGTNSPVGSGFYGGGVGEFRAIIRKDNREEGTEIIVAETIIKKFDPFEDSGGGIVMPEKNRHKIAFEPEREENL